MKRGSKKHLSLIQILILIIGIISFSHLIGLDFKIISGLVCTEENKCTEAQLFGSKTPCPTCEYYRGSVSWEKLDSRGEVAILSFNEIKELDTAFNKLRPELPPETGLSSAISGATNKISSFFLPAEGTITNVWESSDGHTIGSENIHRITRTKGGEYVTYTKNDQGRLERVSLEEGQIKEGISTGAFEQTKGGFWKGAEAIGGNFLWAVGTYGLAKTLGGSILGMGEAETDAFATAAAMGLFAGKSAIDLGITTKGGWVIGIAAAAITYAALYEEEEYQTYTFTCGTWHPPAGGENCELCNDLRFPCSEYQCKSLGEACELINKGTNEEKCIWKDPMDSTPPIISLWDSALLSGYEYTPDTAISPPARGTIIKYNSTDGCVPAFSPFTFGIELDEPAKCRLDYERKPSYEEMRYNFGGSSLFKYNHTNIMSLPGPGTLESENITLSNDGKFDIYVKCQDANGNFNLNDFVFKFCVDPSPDTTPPIIKRIDPINGAPIRAGETSVDVNVYLNEPSTCKWSHSSQTYEQMENEMSCSRNVMQMNAEMLYKCGATLDGLKDREEKLYYFACKDQPFAIESKRNPNQIYEYKLIGTQPLYISSASPNNTEIRDATDAIKVTLETETRAGYQEGKSTCFYSRTGNDNDYIEFDKTNSHIHSQNLFLAGGFYDFYIKCVDAGANTDTTTINFNVYSDTDPPTIARTFRLADQLVVIIDEPGECIYSPINCEYNFEDGIKMRQGDSERKEYQTLWESDKIYYIKCKDVYDNYPAPNKCSVIIKPLILK